MIRRLRRKLVAITMVLLAVMLVGVLGFLNVSTRAGLRNDSLADLRAAEVAFSEAGRPGKPGTTSNPCFVLEIRYDGSFVAVGTERYDLSDGEALLELLEEAMATGQESGVLENEQLRYLRLEAMKYSFVDISGELQTLQRLDLTCIAVLVVGLVALFCFSNLFARRAVRPVERAWEQQRQFVADASHELKTPLTVILTNAELLTDPGYEAQDKERFSRNILTMSRQMRGLVEELLDQARVDNGKAAEIRQELDLSELVNDAALVFEPVYFEAGRTLEQQITPGLQTLGSPRHLRQVVEILLDNGCKYSTPGGTVLLRLEKHGRGSLLSVTSPGQALTREQCADIFKRFYRVDAARSMDHSYGLGLSIAQGIVEQHGGQIWAQSQDGWNTFFVSLPG